MIKGIWSGVTVFLILALSAASYGWEFKLRGDHDWEYRYDLGWEGRMRGMGRPQGLVPGGTDLFTHPVKILNTQGSRFYGHLGYRYTDVDADTRMDVDADIPPQSGPHLGSLS